jgi:hypothetical protein
MNASLFGSLPEQRAPTSIETDEHVLEKCRRCGGRGWEHNPFPRWHDRWLDWDPECRRCSGVGVILSWIGPRRSA